MTEEEELIRGSDSIRECLYCNYALRVFFRHGELTPACRALSGAMKVPREDSTDIRMYYR